MMDIPQVLAVLRPKDDWGPCAQSDSDYAAMAAKWRGASPVPTKAEMLAAWATIKSNAPAVKTACEKADADVFVTASGPTARSDRALARVTLQSIGRVIDKVNECVVFCNTRGASITPLTKSTWPQLLAAVKAANAAETNAVQ